MSGDWYEVECLEMRDGSPGGLPEELTNNTNEAPATHQRPGAWPTVTGGLKT